MKISEVTTPDLPALLPLMRAYCDFYEVAPTDQDLTAISQALIENPTTDGVQFLAADATGSAVGFATVYWSWSTTSGGRIGIMHDLFVTESGRGSGAAQALIEACATATTAHGGLELIWQTALENSRAQAVYDKTGASKSTWHEYDLPT